MDDINIPEAEDGPDGPIIGLPDMDGLFVVTIGPDGIRTDEIKLPCGHTAQEHDQAFVDHANEAKRLIADVLAHNPERSYDTDDMLVRAAAADVNTRSIILQVAYALATAPGLTYVGIVDRLIGNGWYRVAMAIGIMGEGYQHTDEGRVMLEAVLSKLDPSELMALVRVAASGAAARKMGPSAVRRMRTVWDRDAH